MLLALRRAARRPEAVAVTGRAAGRSRTHCAVEFEALPSRIGQVRRIVTEQLHHWRLDPLIDAAALGVTELLTNVHRHTGPDKHCTVELVYLKDRLTVSVRDHDPRLPRLRHAQSTATTGRGLALIAAVSDTWGMRAQHDGSGKVVWFTLPLVLGAPLAGGTTPTGVPALPALAATGTPPGGGTPDRSDTGGDGTASSATSLSPQPDTAHA